METIAPKITQIKCWDSVEVYLLDKDDKGYIIKNHEGSPQAIEEFEEYLENYDRFRDDLRGLLHSLNGSFPMLATEATGDPDYLIYTINNLFDEEPDEFFKHFKYIP